VAAQPAAPALLTYPRRARSLTSGTAARVSQRRDDARGVIAYLSLWLTTEGGAAGEPRPRRRRRGVPRTSGHPGRPRVPHAPSYLSAAAAPAGGQTLTAPGEEPLPFSTVPPGEQVEEEKEGRGAARGGVSPRSRSRPREEPEPP
jgi:hypothetical protein